MISHYKGKYRILCEYDKRTNQFPRKLNGTFEDIDCYITCHRGRIYHFGNRILEYYTDSLQRGHNIIKAIKEQFHGEEIIHNIVETSSEVLFRFNAKDMERLKPFLKPKTSGADRSPFSTKNLPKTKYTIPDEDLKVYKEIISEIKGNNMLIISKITNNYIKSKGLSDDIKRLNIKQIEYLHLKNEFNEFIIYLKEEVEKYNLQKDM